MEQEGTRWKHWVCTEHLGLRVLEDSIQSILDGPCCDTAIRRTSHSYLKCEGRNGVLVEDLQGRLGLEALEVTGAGSRIEEVIGHNAEVSIVHNIMVADHTEAAAASHIERVATDHIEMAANYTVASQIRAILKEDM